MQNSKAVMVKTIFNVKFKLRVYMSLTKVSASTIFHHILEIQIKHEYKQLFKKVSFFFLSGESG